MHISGDPVISKRFQLLAAAALAGCLAATSAPAAIVVTNVGAGNGDNQFGTVNISGWGQPWTTPILLTDTTGKTYVAFCDDLQHDINIAGGQHLRFDVGQVQVDGFGNLLGTFGGGHYTPAQTANAQSISNRMGQIADIGRNDYLHGDLMGADAAQAAIWGLEYAQYGWTVSASNATVEHDLLQDLKVLDNGRGWATGLISESGVQSQILGGVPEPATWMMLILGVAMIGAARRRTQGTAVTA